MKKVVKLILVVKETDKVYLVKKKVLRIVLIIPSCVTASEHSFYTLAN